MSTKILVPLDGSSQAYGALTYTLEQYAESEVAMLHVTDPIDHLGDHPLHLMRESSTNGADEILSEAQSLAADYDASCTPVREIGQPPGVIISYTEEHDIEEIVMGSHGRTGASRVLLGSVAEAVIRRAPTPVTVIRSQTDTDEHQQSDRVLVPINEGNPSDLALEYALETFPDADITVLHVTDPIEESKHEDSLNLESEAAGTYLEERIEEAEEQAESLLDDAERRAADHGTEIRTASKSGRPKRQIVAYAETNRFDHVVIGSHGRTGVSRVLLGSVAETVVRRAHCPVTVAR